MTTLYHASAFHHTVLKPGFDHTNKLIEWDQTESNKFLYATTEAEVAIDQGFASYLEHHFPVNRYQSKGLEIVVTLEKGRLPVKEEFKETKIFLYEIELCAEDGWIKVGNTTNGLENEYKTPQTVEKNIRSISTLSMGEWLKHKVLIFNRQAVVAAKPGRAQNNSTIYYFGEVK